MTDPTSIELDAQAAYEAIRSINHATIFTDAGAEIRLHPVDLPLVLQEQLDLLSDRRDTGASDAELAELVADLLCLQEW